MSKKILPIQLRGAKENNLKNLDLDIYPGQLVVITGLSGTGKSTLLFDVLHAEGQRRYVETFSPYVRQFMEALPRPNIQSMSNARPSIAVEQKNSVKNSRSTVGTMTELCDYFKIWFPQVAQLHDPDDENTRFISYCANEKKMHTGYLSLTRGDGGQNLIGTEIRDELGVLRTQELLSARAIDGGEQFFTRANDFGYSKNPKETLKIWDKDKILSDVVWVIRKFRPDSFQKGNIKNLDGKVIGVHDGIINFTIGQRKGIKVSDKEALYVLKINSDKNEIIVGPKENLGKKEISLKDLNLLTDKKDLDQNIFVKVRSTGSLLEAKVDLKDNNSANVHLLNPEDGISPGQACVFYSKDQYGHRVLGGGWIKE